MTSPTTASAPVTCKPRAQIDLAAWLVTRDNIEQVAQWCGGRVAQGAEPSVIFHGADDETAFADIGDVVLRGVTGLFFALPEWLYRRDYEEIQG